MDRVVFFNLLYSVSDFSPRTSLGWLLLLFAPVESVRIFLYIALTVFTIVEQFVAPTTSTVVLSVALAISSKWIFLTPTPAKEKGE